MDSSDDSRSLRSREAGAPEPPPSAESDLLRWGEKVGVEGRKTFQRFARDGFFDRYMSGDHVLDVGYKGYVKDAHPILPHAIGVDLDYPGYDGKTLPFDSESQDAVFSSHTLEHIADYRTVLRDWFRVLKVGGYLIIVVPHQYLYERRREPPSRWNADHKRFYTAASLLREIEEALPPTAFRVRMLEDNDADFDYRRPIDQHASGSYEIICVLQKLASPSWAEAVFAPPKPAKARAFRLEPTANADAIEPINVITSAPSSIRRVLVMKLDHRGDFALAGDAFEALRRNFDQAHLTLLCGSWNLDDARRSGLFDAVIPFDYFAEHALQAGRPFGADKDAHAALTALLGGEHYDLAIDLRMDSDTRHLLRAIDADQRAGFAAPSYKRLDITAPIPQVTGTGKALNLFFGATRYIAFMGDHRGYAIEVERLESQPPRSLLFYGPYETLPAGQYHIQFLVESRAEPFRICYDICGDRGNQIFRIGDVEVPASGRTELIGFRLNKRVDHMEFRVYTDESGNTPPFRFFGCSIQRDGERDGVHQSEAMLILANLAFARTRRPYRETRVVK